MMRCTWEYDDAEDGLFLSLGRSNESVELRDGVILDLDKAGKVVGLELFDASRLFKALGSGGVTKKDLQALSEVSVAFTKWRHYFVIEPELRGARQLKEKLTIPAADGQSELLAAVA